MTLTILFSFYPVDGSASTLVALDLDDLVSQSESIVTGRVIDSVSYLTGGRIFTLHRIEVDNAINGATNGEIIEVTTAGGRSEHFSQKVFGAATLEAHGRYLLFLTPATRNGSRRVVGMSQGALPVDTDTETREPVVRPLRRNARLLRHTPNGPRRYTEASPWLLSQRPLNDVIEEIASKLRGTR